LTQFYAREWWGPGRGRQIGKGIKTKIERQLQGHSGGATQPKSDSARNKRPSAQLGSTELGPSARMPGIDYINKYVVSDEKSRGTDWMAQKEILHM